MTVAGVLRDVRWAAEDLLYDAYDLFDAVKYKVEHDDRWAVAYGLLVLAFLLVAFGLAGASDASDPNAVVIP